MPNGRHIALGTISFAVCFSAWGLIGAFAPHFRETFHLTASETALLVAVPVLLGSLARIPMGMLTDRFGVTWQIIPDVLIKLLTDKDSEKAKRVTQAMMQMIKLDIAGLKKAHAGG